jgi:hypothetical protein
MKGAFEVAPLQLLPWQVTQPRPDGVEQIMIVERRELAVVSDEKNAAPRLHAHSEFARCATCCLVDDHKVKCVPIELNARSADADTSPADQVPAAGEKLFKASVANA